MAITASMVAELRAKTDAPMMECKAALDESGGDMKRAEEILREKGKAAAAKRQGRSTAAGVVAFATTDDGKTVGGVVVESETDFVARNEDFIAIAQKIAEVVRDAGDDSIINELVEGAIAKIRENIQVTKKVRMTANSPILTYVHHDRTKGSAVVVEGADGADQEALRKIAVHVVSAPPEVINKEDLSKEKIDSEIAIETQRAINEGKDAKMAENIARGRVNKEFVKKAVLNEQVFYADPTKSVAQYMAETAKGAKITRVEYFAVGGGE